MLFKLVRGFPKALFSGFGMEEVVSYLRPSFGGASPAMASSFGAPEWLIRSTNSQTMTLRYEVSLSLVFTVLPCLL